MPTWMVQVTVRVRVRVGVRVRVWVRVRVKVWVRVRLRVSQLRVPVRARVEEGDAARRVDAAARGGGRPDGTQP